MKKYLLLSVSMAAGLYIAAQHYPSPEYSNEVYYLQKGDSAQVMRLEKGSSKMDTKMKMGGFGGAESAYLLEGEKSTVRLSSGKSLSFIYSTGSASIASNPASDSVMRANGVDPGSMNEMMAGMNDPSNLITLYKTITGKNVRKVMLQKSPGMFGGKKSTESEKYTFSVKKIREGYWELVIDKSLPRGEYAFTMMGMGSMDGAVTLFAFAID